MAGSYADAPNNRISYDSDGTIALKLDTTASLVETNYTQANLAALNNEASGLNVNEELFETDKYFVFLFPIPMDVTHVHFTGTTGFGPIYVPAVMQYSANTTNGIDGTWNGFTGIVLSNTAMTTVRVPVALTSSVTNAISIRLRMDGGSLAGGVTFRLHLYGKPSAASRRLDFWHPTLDQRIPPAHFDFGDTPQGSSADITYRVKNLSSTQTAQGIVISTEMLRASSPSIPGMFTHSTDGTTFTSTTNIGNLAPDTISGVLTVRRAITTNAPLGLWWPRYRAAPTSWV